MKNGLVVIAPRVQCRWTACQRSNGVGRATHAVQPGPIDRTVIHTPGVSSNSGNAAERDFASGGLSPARKVKTTEHLVS